MRGYQDKKKYKHFLYSPLIIGILILLVLFFGRATWRIYEKERASQANALRAHEELQKLEEREQLLKSELERLQTEEGIEEEIRSKYSVSKPGENIVIIVDKDEQAAAAVMPKESWWDKFKKIFQ